MSKELAKMESTLADAKRHESRLAVELAKAQAAAAAAIEERRTVLLTDATDNAKAVSQAEAKAAQAERMLAAVANAAQVAKARATAAEQALTAARAAAAREARAAEITSRLAPIEKAFKDAQRPIMDLVKALGGGQCPEATQAAVFATDLLAALQNAFPHIAGALGALAGEALRTDAPPVVVPLARSA
jgi:hypothetical protein